MEKTFTAFAIILVLGLPMFAQPNSTDVQHIVIIYQENRSTDNLFWACKANGQLGAADIQNVATDSHGNHVTLWQSTMGANFEIDHEHNSFWQWCNANHSGPVGGGAGGIGGTCPINGADLIGCTGTLCSHQPAPVYSYVQLSTVQPYCDMADTYAFGDRMFQSQMGSSWAAHTWLFNGDSSMNSCGQRMILDSSQPANCVAPATQRINSIWALDPAGYKAHITDVTVYPCVEHLSITDELEAAGLTWRYYQQTNGGGAGNLVQSLVQVWCAPCSVKHICNPSFPNGASSEGTCNGSDFYNGNVIINPPQVLADIANSNLPNVTWVIPQGSVSDHAISTGEGGPAWVASIVNAIGSNPNLWPNTVIFVTWDDWGGMWDHVSPPIINAAMYGPRVPLIVISPFVKQHYVSHSTYSFGSILKFIEQTWGLAPVGLDDQTVDSGAPYAQNLNDLFCWPNCDPDQKPAVRPSVVRDMSPKGGPTSSRTSFTPIKLRDPIYGYPEYWLNRKDDSPPDTD